ncbi:MAG: hypothetical protein PF961_11780 [Planctomycetota bacterium]|jgi:hypothetical protein|nr:hypothetical protein [Planctomycetota bacterium]
MTNPLRLLCLSAAVLIATALGAQEHWLHNTFPGPGHVATPGPWGPGQGSDRSEWVAGFGVSPLDPQFMLMATDMAGLSVATDGAWFRPAQLPVRHGHAVAFSPHDAATAYALMSDPYSGQGQTGWWRTTDRGATWALMMKTHRVRAHARRLIVDRSPVRAACLYVATEQGVQRSADDGATWLPFVLEGVDIWTMANTCDGASLYVITGQADQRKLYRIDNGDAATLVQLSTGIHEIDTHPSDPGRGFWVDGQRVVPFSDFGASTGDGVHSNTSKGIRQVRINPSNPDHVIAYAWGGLAFQPFHYSRDGGRTWGQWALKEGWCPGLVDFAPLNHASPNYALDAGEMMFEGDRDLVAFVPGDPDAVVMWATNYVKGPVRSDDYGATFAPFGHGGSFKAPSQIAFGGQDGVMALSRQEYGFVLTSDGGMTWRGYGRNNVPCFQIPKGKPLWKYRTGWGVALDPDDDQVVLGTFGFNPVRLVRSADFGVSWEVVGTFAGKGLRNDDFQIFWHPQDPNVIYTCGHRSDDRGRTWTKLSQPVTAISSSNGDVVMCRPERNTLMVSLNRGESWVSLPNMPGQADISFGWDNFAIDPRSQHDPALDGLLRMLITGRNGVWEYSATTPDASEGTWTHLGTGIKPEDNLLVDEVYFSSVSFDPRPGQHQTVYLAAGHSGPGKGSMFRHQIYRSHDSGASWHQIIGAAFPGMEAIQPGSTIAVCPSNGVASVFNYNGLYSLHGGAQP